MLVARRRISEGPGTLSKRSGPSTCSRGLRTRLRFLYARISRRCLALCAGCMRAREESYRLYSCRRCAQQVRICRRCDRGHQYCAADCARVRRRESLRRAGARYQMSYRGASRHAARQRVWRARQMQKVTHHGSPEPVVAAIVAASSTTPTGHDADHAAVAPPWDRPAAAGRGSPRRARCCFCGRRLPRFARVGPLRGGP